MQPRCSMEDRSRSWTDQPISNPKEAAERGRRDKFKEPTPDPPTPPEAPVDAETFLRKRQFFRRIARKPGHLRTPRFWHRHPLAVPFEYNYRELRALHPEAVDGASKLGAVVPTPTTPFPANRTPPRTAKGRAPGARHASRPPRRRLRTRGKDTGMEALLSAPTGDLGSIWILHNL